MLTRFWKKIGRAVGTARASAARKPPRFEMLEERQMLSAAVADYVLSGSTWTNPSHITYSFPADGVSWDQAANNLNTHLNVDYAGGNWKRDLAKALQTWASVANINVVQTSDSNADFNTSGLSQGDPRFGDVRFGGYDFGNQTSLAQTYYPPPNGVTAAGDVEVNTNFKWGPNAPYDLYSVMLHETGHSLGLAHSPQPTAVMNAVYGGVRTGLTPFDVEGIQAIYGARGADLYQAAGKGVSTATAIDVNAGFGNMTNMTVWGVSLATVGDTEYFSVVAPSGMTNESLNAIASATNLSSLSPKISVFDTSGTLLGSSGDANAWGDDATTNLGNIQPGQRYTIAVTGATNDVFAVGSYALKLSFAGTATPPPAAPVPPPVAPTPAPVAPTPPAATPPVATPSQAAPPVVAPPVASPPVASPPVTMPPVVNPSVATPPVATPPPAPSTPVVSPTVNLGGVTSTTVNGQSLATSMNVNVYAFVASKSGTAVIATGSTTIQVVNQFGQIIASGRGQVSFQVPNAGARYSIVVSNFGGPAVPYFNLSIVVTPQPSYASHPAAPARRKPTRRGRQVVSPHTDVPSKPVIVFNPNHSGGKVPPGTTRLAVAFPKGPRLK